ncbi:MAG: SUMF1/EgtB/PvdO family nonheme iron enzyme [bacterium]|nr:SUMF1/EgtB/PvdO family nonheme iron enzyme [bacterium]
MLIIVLAFSIFTYSQVFVQHIAIDRYMSKFKNTTFKDTYKLNKDGNGSVEITLLISTDIPNLWYPVISSGINEVVNEKIIQTKGVFYSKAIKHKVFESTVFFSPIFDTYEKDSYKTGSSDSVVSKKINISSSRFYLRTEYVTDKSTNLYDPLMSVGYQLSKERIDFLNSFYFKRYEVTNAEYREFTNWVRDSVAMELLIKSGFDNFKIKTQDNKYRLNWSMRNEIWTLQEEEIHEALTEIYVPAKERFYRRKEIDAKKLIYKDIPIYPDTTVWIIDYTYSYNEPICRQYFSHPKYDNHPVVGVNWYQAKAFCEWKTKMLQFEIDKDKSGYKLVVELPAEFEREYVLSQFDIYNKEGNDFNYLPSLMYKQDYFKMYLGHEILWKSSRYYKKNGYLYTHPADISKIKIKSIDKKSRATQMLLSDYDRNGISGLKSNVSEWMKESYPENWSPVMKMRHGLYHSVDYKECKKEFSQINGSDYPKKDYDILKRDIEDLEKFYTIIYPIHYKLEKEFDNMLDKEGKLVRGSNWYDETFERHNIFNAKTFISPDSAYSTIGFRYVIHVYPKED